MLQLSGKFSGCQRKSFYYSNEIIARSHLENGHANSQKTCGKSRDFRFFFAISFNCEFGAIKQT